MCNKCDILRSCPIGEKRILPLVDVRDGRDFAKVSIVIDRVYGEPADVFIASETAMGGLYANVVEDIVCCPYCGESLKGEKYD